ncbi:MAG TPA: hypothetical protein VGO67_07390 [Verrucomicrobiae bacterium]|jgi:hypothetical protein
MIKTKTTGLITALVGAICASSASAQFTESIGGQAEPGANYVNFDTLTSGQNTTFTSGALTLNFTGDAAEDGPGGTAPYLSGNNNVNFGPAATGPDATPWVATGTPGQGTLVFDFSSAQNYLGLLWGSVDSGTPGTPNTGNVLTFYSGLDGSGTVVQTITGADLRAGDATLNNGDVGIDGTTYVNVNTASGFQSVVATTGTTTFEIDNVAYGNLTGTVPDGTLTLSLLGGSMIGLQALRRKLTR